MKILYDFQGLSKPVGGVSRCICEYINEIRKTNEVKISCPMTRNIYMREILGIKTSSFMKPNHYFAQGHIQYFTNLLSSYIAVKKNDYDVFHPTFDMSYYYGNIIRKPYVLTIHDLIPELYYVNDLNNSIPNLDLKLKNKKRAIKGASRIMCVSENTRKEMLEYYSFIDPGKVDVVYHGVNTFIGDYHDNIYGDYILFIGQRNSYKNFLFTIKALRPVFVRYDNIKMICTGSKFSFEELKEISNLGLEGRIVNVGYVDENSLASLYHNALTFIFPSLYEGFGIPILEAFVNGCPVCLANSSCFPEIGADAVSYFEPEDELSILHSVLKVIEDTNYASFLRTKGYERAILFSWKESASKVLGCYKKVLEA